MRELKPRYSGLRVWNRTSYLVLRIGFVPGIQGDFTATEGRFLRKTLCCILMSAEVRQNTQEGKEPWDSETEIASLLPSLHN